jgi:hypothetical protein
LILCKTSVYSGHKGIHSFVNHKRFDEKNVHKNTTHAWVYGVFRIKKRLFCTYKGSVLA